MFFNQLEGGHGYLVFEKKKSLNKKSVSILVSWKQPAGTHVGLRGP